MTQPSAALLYTRVEVCPLLKCGLSKVDQLIKSGNLPSIKLGGQRLIRDTDLRDFIASRPIDIPGGKS